MPLSPRGTLASCHLPLSWTVSEVTDEFYDKSQPDEPDTLIACCRDGHVDDISVEGMQSKHDILKYDEKVLARGTSSRYSRRPPPTSPSWPVGHV
jgi:hypothetical protein